MQVSASTLINTAALTATGSTAASGTTQLVKLQVQLKTLSAQLKDVEGKETQPEEKERKEQLLQDQIKLLQERIIALNQQRLEKQEKEARAQAAELPDKKNAQSPSAKPVKKPGSTEQPGLGNHIDVYA